VHREAVVQDASLAVDSGLEHVVVKSVNMANFMAPQFWHKIEVEEAHTIRNATSGVVEKEWKVKSSHQAYTWPKTAGDEQITGEDYWSTYRYQLEEFVNRIKGRKGSGVWIDGDYSIGQMAAIDSAYEKAGLPLRPTSTYK